MKGTFNSQQSWEKQTVYDLDNGCSVTLSHSIHYGEFISRIDMPNGSYWHCSNGLKDLPSFAKAWLRGFSNPAIPSLVYPLFKKVYNMEVSQ